MKKNQNHRMVQVGRDLETSNTWSTLSWKRDLTISYVESLLYDMQKGVLFENFRRSSTKGNHKKDALKKNLLQSDREFPAFSYLTVQLGSVVSWGPSKDT